MVPKPDPETDINGCGSYSLNINFDIFNAGAFNECCNHHDACYEDCELTKSKCDGTFNGCLSGMCEYWAIKNDWGFANKLCKIFPYSFLGIS